jgi:hypothetical protein
MGSICTSVNKKDKKSTIVANRKDSERIENDNSIKADNTNPIKNTEDKKNEPNNTSRSKQSDMISENDDENSGNREISKPKKEQNNFSNPDIIISYLDNGKTEFNEIFKTNDNISSLFDILLEKKSKYAQYDLITNEELSLSSKLNEKIGNIFPNTENAEVKMIYIGLDLSDDMKTFYENHNTAIGIPLFNTKEGIDLLIFHKQNKNFTKEEIKNHKLSKFNNLSSICNGKSVLYLSGGDNHNKSKSIDLFASIDLLNIKSINELPKLNIARSRHSMIFIPKKYIFIVGGGTNEVELYNIEKNSIEIDSKMNETRNECTLFIMNNTTLYAFCGVSPDGSFLSTVERCILKQKDRLWSYVNYTTADNTLFEECFYVGSFFSETSLILFSASEDENNEFSSILFDLEYEDNPTLNYYESGGRITDAIPEKVFHPIDQNTSIMFPFIKNVCKLYKINDDLKLNSEFYPEVLKTNM